jgi:arsenate reductase
MRSRVRPEQARNFEPWGYAGLCWIVSADPKPGTMNSLAVENMREVGIDISCNSTCSVFDLFRSGELFHYVIAVCDKANYERCPIFTGIVKRID